MYLLITALKILGLFVGSVIVVYNIELLFVRIFSALGLRQLHQRLNKPTVTEFIVLFLTIAGILLSFRLTGIVYGYFGVSGRVWPLVLYMMIDIVNSFMSVLGMTKDAFSRRFIVYDDEIYPVFAGRLVGFPLSFALLALGMI